MVVCQSAEMARAEHLVAKQPFLRKFVYAKMECRIVFEKLSALRNARELPTQWIVRYSKRIGMNEIMLRERKLLTGDIGKKTEGFLNKID
tara:strand:- start:680 stop:949 length:270 start_codon:yes stop_codon:yes gene_type:complete